MVQKSGATATFNYATKTVNRPGAHNHPDPTDRTISVRLLQSIDLPGDNGAFVMGNVAGPAYNDQGLVTQVRLPTLGYLEWDWENYPFPKLRTLPPNQEEDEAVDPYNAVFGVSKRRQKGINGGVLGEWTYSRDFTPGIFVDGQLPERLRVTVHRPSGDKSEHYFSVYPAKDLSGQPAPQWGTGWDEYSLPYTRSESDPIGGARHLSSKIFDCDASGNGCDVVRSEYVEYELDDSAIQNDATGILFNKNRRLKSRRILDHYTDSGGTERTDWRLETMSDFDGLGHYRSSTISSNYGPTRTSFTHFNEDRGTYPGAFSQFPKTSEWITGLFDKTSITEGSRTEHEEFCFDEETGLLERHRILKGTDGNPSDDDLIQSFTADGRGQINAQFWFGGDLVPVATAVDLCAMGLGTSSFRLTHTYAEGVLKTSRYTYDDGSFDSGGSGGPLTFYNVENTAVDSNTGLVKTSRAPSGISTSYTYDVLGRLRSIQPGSASGAAWTKIWFGTAINSTQPARAEVRELPNGSLNNNDALTEKRYRWDGLGRLDQERVSLPPGSGSEFSDRYHFYDGQGRRYATTTWGGSQATGLQQFDAFDRPRVIYPPDANTTSPEHAIELSYEGFRRITRTVAVGTELDDDGEVVENPISRTEEYDALGRLVAVTEPSGAGGANITTTYAYDLKDRLTGITMPVGGGQQQARSWTYDPRGFLMSECHPEKGGTNGGGCTQYSLYNAMGQATQVVDGPFTRKYSYDRAGGRLTAVRDGGSRLLKSFDYGKASSAGNRANGQLVRAVNYQYPDLGAGIREQRFVEDFTYGGVGGSRDHRQVSWIRQCEPGETSADCLDDGFCDEESFEHSEALDPTGKLASLTYPTCTSADSGCGAPHPRAVDYSYDSGSGFLTGIPGWADAISYHSNMALNEIHHANGIVDVIGRDPNFMSRPSSLHVESAGGATLWESGTFRYDGAGNLLEMAATDFTDRFVYDGVSRLVHSRQWVRRSPDAGSDIFTDGFESGDTSEWVEFQESYLADVYTEQTFTFDIPGNLLSVDTDGDIRTHSVSSTTNRLGGTAQYDSAGNLTQFTDESGQAVTFEYDAFNRLIYREQDGHFTHFLYTADDERILRFGTGGFTWSLRDFQGRVLREFRPESNRLQPIRDHIYRGSAPIATVTVDENDILSKRHHLSLDHLGSPRYITDGAGSFLSEHKYYPFGEEATRPAQNDLPLKFTGHERDFYAEGASDDLDYMHARFCDPRVGRFLSVDPVLGSPDLPQSWNRYAYVQGNPLMYVDPMGMELRTSDVDVIREIVGEELGAKVVLKDGVVDMSQIDPADLSGNEGAALIYQLASSEKIYVFSESEVAETSAGSVEVDAVLNLDTNEDWRIPNKQGHHLPPPGVDGLVAVHPAASYLDAETLSRPVSRRALVFHELAEAFAKVDGGMPYVKRGGGHGAHAQAVERERILITQRPDFTVYPAGGILRRKVD